MEQTWFHKDTRVRCLLELPTPPTLLPLGSLSSHSHNHGFCRARGGVILPNIAHSYSPNVRVARFDCVEIVFKCSSAAQVSLAELKLLRSSESTPTQDLSGRCLGSFPRPFLFIGDRHVFYLLLVCFCAFSVHIKWHHCVLKNVGLFMLDYHSLASSHIFCRACANHQIELMFSLWQRLTDREGVAQRTAQRKQETHYHWPWSGALLDFT